MKFLGVELDRYTLPAPSRADHLCTQICSDCRDEHDVFPDRVIEDGSEVEGECGVRGCDNDAQHIMHLPEVRCNNCDEYFGTQFELAILKDADGEYRGCPCCETDEYLMDLVAQITCEQRDDGADKKDSPPPANT